MIKNLVQFKKYATLKSKREVIDTGYLMQSVYEYINIYGENFTYIVSKNLNGKYFYKYYMNGQTVSRITFLNNFKFI